MTKQATTGGSQAHTLSRSHPSANARCHPTVFAPQKYQHVALNLAVLPYRCAFIIT